MPKSQEIFKGMKLCFFCNCDDGSCKDCQIVAKLNEDIEQNYVVVRDSRGFIQGIYPKGIIDSVKKDWHLI